MWVTAMVLWVGLMLGASGPALAEDVLVVVHERRQLELDRAVVAQIYLKQRRFWSDGSAILAVNRDARSALRDRFERAVFGSDRRRLGVHWNRAYFRGVLPPITLASDEAVRRFVRGEPRAIGYVRAGGAEGLRRGLRVVLVLSDVAPGPTGPAAEDASSR